MKYSHKKLFLLFFLLPNVLFIFGQDQTIGTFLNSPEAYHGYTLITPGNNDAYLINNCGEVVHEWTFQTRPGAMTYVLNNGTVLRTGKVDSDFNGGGGGGLVQIYSWESELLWSYTFSNDITHQHHDVEYLANGNILVLAWELSSYDTLIELGRDPINLTEDGIWFESVTEIKPIGDTSIEEIWKWNIKDHLIQDFDPEKLNFGVVAEHPHKLDINALSNSNPDWLHFNSLDYNPSLDQIILSSRTTSEMYVIDHSTTTEEAKTNKGGFSDKGGDLLFRWGNPSIYKSGTLDDQILFNQHDVHWVEEGLPNEGSIIYFNNNKVDNNGTSFSSVDIIKTIPDNTNNYPFSENTFAPNEVDFTYGNTDNELFFSVRISGVEVLPNGNILICEGRAGRIFEIDQDRNIVWDYVNPATNSGLIEQSDQTIGNDLFRAVKYPLNFQGFSDKDLEPKGTIEGGEPLYDCLLYQTASLEKAANQLNMTFNNPVHDMINIQLKEEQPYESKLQILDVYGNHVILIELNKNRSLHIPFSNNPNGMYVLRIVDNQNNIIFIDKIIKQ